MTDTEFAKAFERLYGKWLRNSRYCCKIFYCSASYKDVLSDVVENIYARGFYRQFHNEVDADNYVYKAVYNRVLFQIRSEREQLSLDFALSFTIDADTTNELPNDQFTALRERECNWRPDDFFEPREVRPTYNDRVNVRICRTRRVEIQKGHHVYARNRYEILGSIDGKHHRKFGTYFNLNKAIKKAECVRNNLCLSL